jgi:hypothetical protein
MMLAARRACELTYGAPPVLVTNKALSASRGLRSLEAARVAWTSRSKGQPSDGSRAVPTRLTIWSSAASEASPLQRRVTRGLLQPDPAQDLTRKNRHDGLNEWRERPLECAAAPRTREQRATVLRVRARICHSKNAQEHGLPGSARDPRGMHLA